MSRPCLIIDPVDNDVAARRHQLVKGRLGVVVGVQRDAGTLQRIGHSAKGKLDRVFLTIGLNGHGECALDVQGSKAAAERGVIYMVALFGSMPERLITRAGSLSALTTSCRAP